jgi:hypothetical protein
VADIGERVTIRMPGKKSSAVYMERWPGGVAVSHGYGWFVMDPAEWERFKAEGDRLLGAGETEVHRGE